MNRKPLFGGIEAGGTKFVCAVGSGPEDIRALEQFPTTSPDETLSQAVAFLKGQATLSDSLTAVGIASFGPVDVDNRSTTYGTITSTPKPGWQGVELATIFSSELGVPVNVDTDVNGAALAEWRWGAAQDLDTFIYLTIGTGVGGGGMVNNRLLHGLLHPEMGHIPLPHDNTADPFTGICPFHGDCLEGMAAGPAIEARWGQKGDALPPDHPAWELEAHYLAVALTSFIYTLSPQRIILGGGVMTQSQLFPFIRQKVQAYLNGYVRHPAILSDIERYIVPPGLGEQAGILGGIALAQAVVA